MCNFDECKFENQLGRISFSYNSVVNKLHLYPPTLPNVEDRDEYAENFSLPSIIKVFYEDFVFRGVFPTQSQFLNKVLQMVGNKVTDKLWPKTIRGLHYRLNRGYLSIVREFCFVILIRDQFPKLNPIYNIDLDVRGKIDCMIKYNDHFYGLCFMTGTPNGMKALEHKSPHQQFNNVSYINIPINLDNAPRIENLALYTSKDLVEGLKDYIFFPVK